MKEYILIEYGILVTLLAQTILFYEITSNIANGAAAGALFILLLIHKWRFELLPAYFLLAINTGIAFKIVSLPSWFVWIQSIVYCLEVLLVWLFPLPSFPTLSSLYPDVGCMTMRLDGVDSRIFYPADKSYAPKQSYLHHGKHLAIGLHTFINQPAWFFSSLRNGVLNCRVNAPLKLSPHESGWPIVIFSHGMGGTLEMYSSIVQYLASEGFIVVSVNHNDGSASVSRNLDDATYSYYDKPPASALANWAGEGYFIRNKQLGKRVSHVQDVLNAMGQLASDTSSVFFGQIDLENQFAVGHSFGGATVLSAAKRDTRLKAVVGLDIWMEPLDHDIANDGVQVPVLSIISQHWYKEWDSHFKLVQENIRACRHPESNIFAIQGTRHNNFCDLPLFAPVLNRMFKAAGTIEPTYLLEMVSQLTGAFLRQQISKERPFEESIKAFPELQHLKDTSYNSFA